MLALWAKQRQLEQEGDLQSKKLVPLEQTKLNRSVNEEVRSDAAGSKPVWTRDEMGIWRRASHVFVSPVKSPLHGAGTIFAKYMEVYV